MISMPHGTCSRPGSVVDRGVVFDFKARQCPAGGGNNICFGANNMKPFTFNQEVCRNLDKARNLEWLCTNGLGGYASGTIAGINSRKYHGYLVASLRPPIDRYVLWSRVEDRIIIGEKGYALSTNEFPGAIEPTGYRNLAGFTQSAGPVWDYRCGDVLVRKTLIMPWQQQTAVLRYELIEPPARRQEIRLMVLNMLSGRHFHATTNSENRLNWTPVDSGGDGQKIGFHAVGCPFEIHFSHNAADFHDGPCWWYNFVLSREMQRGYPDRDDLWTPGALEFLLKPGRPAFIIGSIRPIDPVEHSSLVLKEQARREQITAAPAVDEPYQDILEQLFAAADQFVVRRATDKKQKQKMSVIAGYPWFEDWGRDTFISLPGLTLVPNRADAARDILTVFADHIQNGLVPNRFPDDADQPDYNTVDASLWFVQAAFQYWRYTGDAAFLTDYLYGPLNQIIDRYQHGTSFGIHMDADGLICCGVPGANLTWMDAKIGDYVVTPRYGKPVEISGLWYNAVRIMEILANRRKDAPRAAELRRIAGLVEEHFPRKFQISKTGYYADVLGADDQPDGLLRPNQLIAASLPFSPVPRDHLTSMVDIARAKLLTPMGLRTLAPGSPGYCGRYQGDQTSRDHAYHQGTAWPWLIGPFVSAFTRAYPESSADERMAFIRPLFDRMAVYGIGSLAEIADGDPPHQPRGCIAQAWSVAEVLRVLWEDVLQKAPPIPGA